MPRPAIETGPDAASEQEDHLPRRDQLYETVALLTRVVTQEFKSRSRPVGSLQRIQISDCLNDSRERDGLYKRLPEGDQLPRLHRISAEAEEKARQTEYRAIHGQSGGAQE